jgi:hypothetical protein
MTNYAFQSLLDFTRTTSGTFVGSNGLIQNTPASVNLFTQTQQFDNASWAKTNATITANSTVAPDGTTTADTITDNSTSGQHQVTQTISVVSGVVYALSVYVKADTARYVRMSLGGAMAFAAPRFDLELGIVQAGPANTTITSVGNNWFRIDTSSTASSSGNGIFAIGITNSTGTAYIGTGSTLFLWGAQLEVGSTATTYTRNNGGVFPPRFDYDPVTLAPKGILIEEQRVNLAQQSSDYTTAFWSKTDVNLTTGIDDPAGGTSATTLTATAASGSLQQPVVGGVASTTYSASFWIRRRTGTGQISLRCGDLTAIPITVTSSWLRYVVTAVASTTTVRLAVVLTTSGDAVDVWGGQIEAGAFATSYIPTVASTVTRAADQTSIVAPNFAPWYNQSEGSFVLEATGTAPTALSVAYNALTASDGTFNNCNRFSSFLNFWIGDTRTGGVQEAQLYTAGTYTPNTPAKVAYAYKTNDFAASFNGATALTDTSGSVPTVINRLDIGAGFGVYFNGHIRSVRYYPVRLSNAQLQALTA